MLGLAEAGQVRVNDGGDRALMAEVDLDLAEVLALLQEVRRIRVAQGVDVRLLFDAAGLEGKAESALQRGTAHRFGGGAGAQPTVPLGGKEQCGMAMRFPLLAQEQQGAFGQRDIAVLVTLAAADVNEHPFGINVADLQAQPFAQAQAAGVNGDQADAMVQGGDGCQNAAHLGAGEHDREFELGIGAGQFQFVWPGALEGFFPEQFDGADGLGAGLPGDLFVGLEMDAVLANVLGAEQVGRLGVELAELADTGVIGRFGARADRQELEVVSEGF
jgi:hypothetical protein